MSKQYHLHTPSEHQINGIAADLELHIVHALNSDIFKN
jgi:carbonic anhydrase